jgi:hypothetical protein
LKVRDLLGWPPRCFQDATDPSKEYQPRGALRLESVTHIPGGRNHSEAALAMILVDDARDEACTALLKVANEEVARSSYLVLKGCKGLTLAEAGVREIPSDQAKRRSG